MNARILLVLLASALLQDEAARPTVTVTTLELDRELVAYGRLGGVAVDAEGTIFVSNFGPNVWAVTPEGKVTELAADFVQASGNAVGPDGTLLQADFARKAIYALDPETGEASPVAATGLTSPIGLVADEDWNLYVCDCNSNSIKQVTPEGEVRTLASGALFACPNGITRDARGNLYVVSFANDLLVEIDASGAATAFATVGAGDGNAHLARAGGELYVTKVKTNELWAVPLDEPGEPRLVAGSGEPELIDGKGTAAALKRPNGLAASPDGERLYTNNLVGTWRDEAPTRLVLRVIALP